MTDITKTPTPTKVVLTGNSRAGKTSIIHGLLNIADKIEPTVGCEIHSYTSKDGSKYDLWDCAGREDYRGLADGYYIWADIIIIVEGGEDSVREHYTEVIRVSPDSKIHYLKGNYNQKLAKLKEILG